MPNNISDIRSFLSLKRIAFVGVSRDPKDFSRLLFREMCKRGYDMVPVNPAVGEVEMKRCFPRVQDITPAVDGALLMTKPSDTDHVVRDCAAAGIRDVWMHRAGGHGSVSQDAVRFCHEQGINVVEGHCPFMFFEHTPFFHRVHGFFMKITGKYPGEMRPAA